MRAAAPGRPVSVFVYPRSAHDPDAETVANSFRLEGSSGFSSPVGRVAGDLYIGRTSAGGEGDRIDCDGDGRTDAEFADTCRFILQLDEGRIAAVEVDRDTRVNLGGRQIELRAFTPVAVTGR